MNNEHTILVAEFGETVDSQLADLLAGLGYRIMAPSAATDDFVARLEAERPDIVILNLSVGVDGDALASAIRDLARKDRSAVLTISRESGISHDDLGERDRAVCLLRPFRGSDHREAVRDALLRAITREASHGMRRFQALAESAPYPIVIFDAGERIVYANRKSSELFQVNVAELAGKGIDDLFPHDTVDMASRLTDALREAMRTGAWTTVSDCKMEYADGAHWFSFIFAPLDGDAGSDYGAVCMARDNTDTVAMLDNLEWNAEVNAVVAELYGMILQSSSIEELSDIILDHAKRLTDSVFGFVGYIDPYSGNLVSCTMTKDVWETCNIPDKRIVFEKFCGLWGWVLENSQPMLCNDVSADPRSTGVPRGHIPIDRFLSVPSLFGQKLVGMIALANARDPYTQRDLDLVSRLGSIYAIAVNHHFLRQDLIEAKEAAEYANRAKNEFLANVSHELRTPLNAILGFGQILEMQKEGRLSMPQREYLRHILKSGHYLLHLVNDILDVSAIEAGRLALVQRSFDLGALIRDLLPEHRLLAEKKRIPILDDVAGDLNGFFADPVRVRQIVNNLLSNAIKYTDPGRRVGLTVRRENARVVIEVWDEGRGISADVYDAIFQPFVQVRDFNASKPMGTGLGLSITKRLVELHGGTIKVQSAIGQGSRFTIIMPDVPSAQERSAESPVRGSLNDAQDRFAGASVLVVEDNELNSILMRTLLEEFGISVQCVPTGEDAVSLLGEHRVDLVFMDIDLPGMSGVEAAHRLREQNADCPPIVALTAYSMKGDRERYLAEGMDGYISKPIEIAGIIAVLDQFLRREGAREDVTRVDGAPPMRYDFGAVAREIGIDTAVFKGIVKKFFDSVSDEYLRDLREAVARGDHDRIHRAAHRFKGSAANLRFGTLVEILRTIDEHARRADDVDYASLCDRVDDELEVLRRNVHGGLL